MILSWRAGRRVARVEGKSIPGDGTPASALRGTRDLRLRSS